MRHRQPQLRLPELLAQHWQRLGQNAGASGRRLLAAPLAAPEWGGGGQARAPASPSEGAECPVAVEAMLRRA
eukprot:15451089-Alexandrium_andersonii.AAC.1